MEQSPCSESSVVIDKLRSEHGRLLTENEALRSELALLQRSKSWRISFPLRMVKPLVGYVLSLIRRRTHELTRDERGMICSSCGRLPTGWVYLSLSGGVPSHDQSLAVLYFDEGYGIREYKKEIVRFSGEEALLRFPLLHRELRMDSTFPRDRKIIAKEVRGLSALVSESRRRGIRAFDVARSLLSSSLRDTWIRVLGRDSPLRLLESYYARWVAIKDTPSFALLQKEREEWAREKNLPLLSVLMTTYNTEERWLRRAIESVCAQTYPSWELCVVDDMSHRPSVRSVLNEYANRESRIRVHYRSVNGHISQATNSALDMAKGSFVALMDHDDELHPTALGAVAKVIIAQPGVKVVFSDEDRLTEEHARIDPYFKNGFDRNLLLTRNCVSHLGVYQTALAREVRGFRVGFEGSQDWDFALRVVERVRDEEIVHIPRVLYHWRVTPTAVSFSLDTKNEALSAGERAVAEHLTRMKIGGKVRRASNGAFEFFLPEAEAGEEGGGDHRPVFGGRVVIVGGESLSHAARRKLEEPIVSGRCQLTSFHGPSRERDRDGMFLDPRNLFDRGEDREWRCGTDLQLPFAIFAETASRIGLTAAMAADDALPLARKAIADEPTLTLLVTCQYRA